LKKFIVESAPDSQGNFRFSGKDFHYLARVRRMRPGSAMEAVLPGGAEACLTVLSLTGNTIVAGRAVPAPAEICRLPPFYLFQALPKGAKMDLIVRQAAEAGIFRIVPFFSEYSQIRVSREEKQGRWERIIKEARQQSGSSVPTSIGEPLDLDGLLEYWKKISAEVPGGTGILLHQNPLEPGTFHDYLDISPSFVVLAVGPEGGFSPEEAGKFVSAGFRPLVMGNTVLRAETAALYGIAAIRTILSERASWLLKKNQSL